MKYLIVEPKGFLDKYLRRELIEAGAADNDVHVGIDLAEPVRYDVVFVHPQGDESIIGRLFDALRHNGHMPESLVLLSSVEVYGRDRGEMYDENTECTPVSRTEQTAAHIESEAARYAAARGVGLTVLRLPLVVGTGMGGMLRRLVNGIYRGSLVMVDGNEARHSVIHAVDVSRVARLAAGLHDVFNLTDGVNPTVNELMEALAHRLDDKRVFSVSPKRARRMALLGRILPQAMNPDMLQWMTTSLTFSCDKLRTALPEFKPFSVTDYLRTHDYGDNSL